MSARTSDVISSTERRLANEPQRGLVSAYVFGSHARGHAHRESDVDIGVLLDRAVFPTARERFEERVRLTAMLGPGPVDPADVVVLNDAPPQLGRRIITEGRRVFCSDDEADHAYVRDVQLLAADIEPFLRRTRLVKLDTLAR